MVKSNIESKNTGVATVQPATILRRIGSTTYVVNVHFSKTSKETIEDKLHRLIKSEVAKIA